MAEHNSMYTLYVVIVQCTNQNLLFMNNDDINYGYTRQGESNN